MTLFAATLLEHGANSAALHLFDQESADLLAYATLTSARQSGDFDLVALRGVYEWQNSPLIFLIDGALLRDDEHLQKIRRLVAMRGDAPYLGVVSPGYLVVYQVGLDARPVVQSRVEVLPQGSDKSATLPHLANVRPAAAAKSRLIAHVILKLLDESITALIQHAVSNADAISLVGRALFTRFLADRELVPQPLLSKTGGTFEQVFDSRKGIAVVSEWLDQTFNGDLLPLSDDAIAQLPEFALVTLGNMMRHAPGGQRSLQWKEDWAHLDFAHIPVGVLSQAYEHYSRVHAAEAQAKEGGYYTPRTIAEMMVRGAFHALGRDGRPVHQARILDPAAGAGVYLLTCFRHLVAERWRHDGKRPATAELREILYNQIAGFDINEAALRFAALGLYLLSIELDPQPHPVDKLRFDDLRGRVLFKVGEQGSLGSLGDGVDAVHNRRYAIVIGNPPWSSSTKLPGWSQVKSRVDLIAGARIPSGGPRPLLPNEVMDLPFVWRSIEWCELGGQIAFALHARLLFQQGDGMPEARAAVFSAIEVSGLVNGAELRNSKVWPEIGAAFCLMFARNIAPMPNAAFRFVSPHREDSLNATGAFRLDAANAALLTNEQLIERPELLKILFRGGSLDLELYKRMAADSFDTLSTYWAEQFGTDRGRPRFAGNGYQKLRPSSRLRKKGDGKAGVSALYLSDMRELRSDRQSRLSLDHTDLIQFSHDRIHDPRPVDIFKGPLLLVHQSPPADAGRIRVSIADDDVVFSESFYGYSAATHPRGALLVRYLALIIGSKPALWHALITSGKFGFEREVIEKAVIDSILVPSFESFSDEGLLRVDSLFEDVKTAVDDDAWLAVDAWVAELYGLRRQDIEVVDDTLRFNLPFAANRLAAQSRPVSSQLKEFAETLQRALRPFADRFDVPMTIDLIRNDFESPWILLRVSAGRSSAAPVSEEWHDVLSVADRLGSVEVLHTAHEPSCLWIARLAQARYWSGSQAILLARRIVWEHLDELVKPSVQ